MVWIGFILIFYSVLLFALQATKIKHSTPDKRQQRYSNADDDIFFDMDGLDCRDSNMHQMTQSDDEDVDDDEDFGMSQMKQITSAKALRITSNCNCNCICFVGFFQKIRMPIEIVELKSHHQCEKVARKWSLLKVFRWLCRFSINAMKTTMKRYRIRIHVYFLSITFSCEMFSILFEFQYQNRQDNVDIAASIKALAQSVHGEAIFGALPKPRFSTQI